ncbi:hypothetical protein GON05_33255 [Paenibacillus sp. MAH-34]|uniref:DUF3006 domain-containing protein n=2 Tax=Paenibacillus TaxID=44249 RepID=A0ABW9UJQ2_9BACL|nr:hypothetical protein [Paenibacillus anseongense]MVQ39470.1 hypothetical protein [Paenibacillus anseongense]
MKTTEGKVIEILFKDEDGFCICDDGWKRPLNELKEPTIRDVHTKRKLKTQPKNCSGDKET